MKKLAASLVSLFFIAACAAGPDTPVAASDDDAETSVLLAGGLVFSGDDSPPVVADVLIRGDRIENVGAPGSLDADRVLDVSGLAVAPGFIDLHSHAVRASAERSGLFRWPDAENLLRQGVTTVIGGPDGWSPLPLAEHFATVEASPAAVNYGAFVGHGAVRQHIIGLDDRAATDQEMAAMRAVVEQAMRDGAFGLSSGLVYIPGSFADTAELVELARVAGQHGGIYISHMRNENLDVLGSVAELIRIAEEGGLPGQITHAKVMSTAMQGRSVDLLAMVDAAVARGVDITLDQYPYAAGSTGLTVQFPRWSRDGGNAKLAERLADAEQRARIRDELIYQLTEVRGRNDPANVQLAYCNFDHSLDGLNLAQLLEQRGRDVSIANAADLIIELQEAGGCQAIYHAMHPDDVAIIMRHPRTMIAADGGIEAPGNGHPHPRNYGTHARVLGRYVRELGVLPLHTAIHKMTRMPAARIGLDDRGSIAAGMVADIVVFDPDSVVDRATFTQPHQYAEGMHHVFVAGEAVLLDRRMTGARPGQVLRSTPVQQAPARQAIIRYDSVHHPEVALHGMVVSQNDLATEVGRDILRQGGNAIDAAVATGFALAVTLPRAGNLGGSGFMLVHLAESGETIALDYRSMAPLDSNRHLFLTTDGSIDWRALTHGAKAAGVPGTVAGFYEAWQRWGTLPWKDLLAPAQELAADGIVVSHDLAFALSQGAQTMAQFPSSAAVYLRPDGAGWQPGERLVQADLAWSIGQIMNGGADAFYRGELASRIAAAFDADRGLITREDLAGYQVKEREIVTTDYRGYKVVSMPPASAGGITLIQMLNMLSEFDLSALGAGSAAHLHLLAEVMKRAAANRRTWLGDPDFVDIPIAELISMDTAKAMAATIDTGRAAYVEDVQPWPTGYTHSHDTTHFSVMDAAGNAVSNTYTLGHSFGNSWVAQGTGILFDNQMRNYNYRDGPVHPNALVPKKRVVSTMTPTIVLDENGDVFLVTGTPGGSYIINVILQLIVNVIDFDMNIAEATHRPRMYQGWRWPQLGLEPGFSPEIITALKARGHETRVERTMGSTQSIVWRDGKFFGAADPRRPNAAALGLMYPPQPRLKAVAGGD